MKQEILKHLLGPGDPGYFIAAFIYAMVGMLISLLVSASKRDQSKLTTPEAFSWRYLLWDNAKKIILTLILVIVTLRFSREFMGADLTMYLALLVGLGWDMLGEMWRKKGLFDKKIPDQNQN